jgi:hypothetical protein
MKVRTLFYLCIFAQEFILFSRDGKSETDMFIEWLLTKEFYWVLTSISKKMFQSDYK